MGTYVLVDAGKVVGLVAATMVEIEIDPDLVTRDELAEALLEADRARSRAEAVELKLLGAFDARQDYAPDGAVDVAGWLAVRGDVTRATARSMAADARKLRQHPESMDACLEVGTAKVREFIRRVISRLEGAYAEAEPVLLGQMRRLKVDDVIMMAKRWVAMVDQDGTEPPENKSSVSYGRTGDAVHGRFTLFGEDAAFFANAVENEADAIWRSEGSEGHLPHTGRRAEALLNLLRKAVGASDTTDPARPTVVVHTTLEQLEGRLRGRLAEVDPFGALISDQGLRRLLCECNLHRFLTGPESVVLDLGRSERLAKGFQRLAVIARDRHCQFPGCDRPPCMSYVHHIVAWETGGNTDLPNLVLLCSRHHHLCHEGGFTCERLPSGALEFRRPDGSILDPFPRPG